MPVANAPSITKIANTAVGVGLLMVGILLGFGVHLALGDDQLQSLLNQQTATNRSDATVLEHFELQTDSKRKKVEVRLYGQKPGYAAIQKAGKQLAIELPMTQLSQKMLDNGLPVVIDNNNKFIGRAVPGQNPHQSRIIIPNFPTSDYDVKVVHQDASGKVTTLARSMGADQTPAPQAQVVQAAAVAENQRTETQRTETQKSEEDAPGLRPRQTLAPKPAARKARQKVQAAQANITPRPAFSADPVGTFEAIAGNYKQAPEAPKPINPSQLPVQLPRLAIANSPTSRNAASNNASPWSHLRPVIVSNTAVSNTAQPETAQESAQNPSRTAQKPAYPIWNPYVVRPANFATAEAPNPQEVPDLTSSGQSFNRLYTSTGPGVSTPSIPRPDPLWYLHQLPSRPTSNGLQAPPISLTPMPDFSQPIQTLPITKSLTAQQAAKTDKATQMLAAPTANKSMIATVKQLILMVPTWAYIALGVFLLGIGAFLLVAAASVLFQLIRPSYGSSTKLPLPPSLWQVQRRKYKRPTAPAPVPSAPEIPSPVASSIPRHTNLSVPEVVFDDVPSLNASRLLSDTPHTLREAVQKSVILRFPTHRPRSIVRSKIPS